MSDSEPTNAADASAISPANQALSAALSALRARTPARLVVGRSGPAYRTTTQLQLREDHAAAVDAVQAELDMTRDLGADLVLKFGLLEVATRARDKAHYLLEPESGRRLSDEAKVTIARECPRGADLQIALGDGLSVAAVIEQAPKLLPLLMAGAAERGWSVGRPIVIRHARVGVLNDLGALLDPQVVVLLIGERPGLATAVSLSAYLAFRPRAGHTDAQRNLISNIHARGVQPATAAQRVLALADQMRAQQTSGVTIKEQLRTALDVDGRSLLPAPDAAS
jgi:ethanolamine ammonia-lyase small subunit